MMLVDGRQRVQSKFRQLEGRLVWFGRVERGLGAARASTRSGCAPSIAQGIARVRTRPVTVRVRFVELSRERDRGGRRQALLGARVDRRDGRIGWLFAGGRRGAARARGAGPAGAGDAGHVRALRHRRRARRRARAVDVSRARAAVSPPALRPRRQPLGNDAAARDPRPLAGDRDPRRVVLRPAARAPTRQDGRRASGFLDDLARHPDHPRLGSVAGGRRAAHPLGHAHGRGDRGDLRGLCRRGRQAALGRQDADVHAPSRRCWSGCSPTRSTST